MERKDPYKYFRIEARELTEALQKGALDLEKSGGSSKQVVAGILRNAHTLKGASRVMKLAAIAGIAHSIEEILAPFREGPGPVPAPSINEILALLDGLSAQLADLNARPAQAPGTQLKPSSERWDTVRLEIAEVDDALERMSEAAIQLSLLRGELAGMQKIRSLAGRPADSRGKDGSPPDRHAWEEMTAWLERFERVSGAALDQAERDLRQAHERTERLRLLTAASLFDFLERAVRDAALSLGKKVRFEAAGHEHRMDAPVLSSLREAMLHIVRNAVAHGLEDPTARIEAGKPEEGLVRIEVERKGGEVRVSCRDDGAGIDRYAVRNRAISKGILPSTAPDPLGMDEAVRLLLLGGISTSGEVSDVSGRGIGMDAVRETVNRLRGSIRIDSAPESGTRVEIQVPYSMTTFPALAVEAGGSPFLIPFDAVRKAVRIVEKDVARSPEGDTILFEDRTIPLLPLEEVFSGRPEKLRRARPAVAVDSPAGSAMVCVDRILGVRQAVARPLPSLAPSDETVGGASMDAEGNPCLVMDPEGLVRYAQGRRGGRHEGKSSAKPIVLIVDDSLTTRMLEQSILESAGYRVETAVSAEDALELARGKRYGLFLVDVEMPGMDGFMLLEKFREDAGLRDIPSILVTSRSSREDRNRAESKGARDYIVKGEFDQARLLGRIKELIG